MARQVSPVPAPVPAAAARPGPSWNAQLGVLWFSMFGPLAGASFVFPFLPLMVREVGVTNPGAIALWSGAAVAASQTCQAAAAPIWGRIADRFGRKPMVVRAAIALAVLMAATGLAPNVYLLITIRALTGVFAGSVAANNALVATLAPRDQLVHSLGVLQSGYYIGTMAGPALGALFVPAFGIRPAFFVAAILPLCSAAAVALTIRESFVRRPASVVRRRTRQVIRDAGIARPLVTLLFMALLCQAIATGLSPAIPLRAAALAGSTHVATAVGGAAALQACGAAVAALTISRFTGRFSYRAVLSGLAMAGAVAFSLIALAPSFAVMLVLIAIGGVCVGGLVPSINALLGTVAPADVRAELFGYSTSATSVGGGAAPVLSGLIAAGFGTSGPFLMIGAIEVLLGVWAFARLGMRNSGLPASPRTAIAPEPVAEPVEPLPR